MIGELVPFIPTVERDKQNGPIPFRGIEISFRQKSERTIVPRGIPTGKTGALRSLKHTNINTGELAERLLHRS